MARSGAATRERILDATESLVLDHGFSATSIDKVVDKTGLTKGAFFYHFKSKADLGRAFMERFAERDIAQMEATMARAERLASDPLQQMLIFVGLYQEQAEALMEPAPGCLFASYLYERMEYPDDVAEITRHTLLRWREALARKLEEVRQAHPPRADVDLEALADGMTAVIEGGYVMAKALGDKSILAVQLELYKRHLELLFAPP